LNSAGDSDWGTTQSAQYQVGWRLWLNRGRENKFIAGNPKKDPQEQEPVA
jgi:hypothetical protein